MEASSETCPFILLFKTGLKTNNYYLNHFEASHLAGGVKYEIHKRKISIHLKALAL